MAEILTGIVQNLEPVMDGDEQKIFENSFGTFDCWNITIDGKTGSCLSKSGEKPWWGKSGVAVLYTLEDKGKGEYNFKGFKKPEGQDASKAHVKEAYRDKPFVSSYNDPVSIRRFAYVHAEKLTAWLFIEIGFNPASLEQLSQNFNYLYNWLVSDKELTKDGVWNKVTVLETAIRGINAGQAVDATTNTFIPNSGWIFKFFPDTDGKEKVTAKLIKYAEFLLQGVNAITKESISE